jgi:hypothetical protein
MVVARFPEQVAALRVALDSYLAQGRTRRNHFEGFKTNRLHALRAKL